MDRIASIKSFLSESAEIHAFGVGALSVYLASNMPAIGSMLALIAIATAIEDIIGEGHYFAFGGAVSYYTLFSGGVC